ncbi:hypothetical protein HK098_001167 [Nowakowskiella sp. JEL0407]|nr:hypothetical protein HK098_001167 [Nowakowskiella sp. JEL0407]
MLHPHYATLPQSQWTPNPLLSADESPNWNIPADPSTLTLMSAGDSDGPMFHATGRLPQKPEEDAWLFSIDDAASYKSSTAGDLVSISLHLNSTLCIANSQSSGRLEIRCKADKKVKIGRICVELMGYEEILSDNKSHHAHNNPAARRRLFLVSTLVLQSVHLPPSNAVIAGTPDEHGMWMAKKGTTVFNFPVVIPKFSNAAVIGNENGAPLPSSFWNRKYGGIRYLISGTVHYKLKSEPLPPLRSIRDIQVLEHAPAMLGPSFPNEVSSGSPLLASDTKKIVANGSSPWPWKKKEVQNIKVDAQIHVPETGQDYGSVTGAWVAGGIGFVGIDITNDSDKKVKSLRLNLIRRLKTFARSTATNSNLLNKNILDHSNLLHPVTFSRTIIASRFYVAEEAPKRSGLPIMRAADGWAEDDFFEPTAVAANGTARISNLEKDVNSVVSRSIAWWNGVGPASSRNIMVDLNIPIWARSIRFGMLIDVSFIVQVVAQIHGGPTIELEMPVTILHPVSLYKTLPNINVKEMVGLSKNFNGNSEIMLTQKEDRLNAYLPPSYPMKSRTFDPSNRISYNFNPQSPNNGYPVPLGHHVPDFTHLLPSSEGLEVIQQLPPPGVLESVSNYGDSPLRRSQMSIASEDNRSVIFQQRNVSIPISTPSAPLLRTPLEQPSSSTTPRANTLIKLATAARDQLNYQRNQNYPLTASSTIVPKQTTLTRPPPVPGHRQQLSSSSTAEKEKSVPNINTPSPISIVQSNDPRTGTGFSNATSASYVTAESEVPLEVAENDRKVEKKLSEAFLKAKSEIELKLGGRHKDSADISNTRVVPPPPPLPIMMGTRKAQDSEDSSNLNSSDLNSSLNGRQDSEIERLRGIIESDEAGKELEEVIEKMFEGINC